MGFQNAQVRLANGDAITVTIFNADQFELPPTAPPSIPATSSIFASSRPSTGDPRPPYPAPPAPRRHEYALAQAVSRFEQYLADRMRATTVGVRHYSRTSCNCVICHNHSP